MKKVYLIILLITILLGAIIGTGLYVYTAEINTDSVYQGIIIDGYDIGGMTKSKALNFIKERKQDDYQDRFFNLSYGDKKIPDCIKGYRILL